MRLLHTSDWHLGRTLHGVDLLDAQAAALDHIVEVTRTSGVDAVLVAGDVFDRAIPPVEAVRLLEETMCRLAQYATVVVTSGNHDSAVRLGYGSKLFPAGIHVVTELDSVGTPVELADEHGPVLVYPLPYLDPDGCRVRLGGDDAPLERSHQAVCAAAMRRVSADLGERGLFAASARTVVMGHAFVVGGVPLETSESERDIRVGGVDSVPSAVFDGVDYVALGHLHGPQEPRAGNHDEPINTRLRYSGSPLRYSFSEATQDKSVSLVELGPDGTTHVETVDVPQPRPMARVSGTMDDLLSGRSLRKHEKSWLQITVTDDGRPQQMRERLVQRFPHLLELRHAPANAEIGIGTGVAHPAGADPIDVASDFIHHVTGSAITEAELDCFRVAHEAVLARERES